MIKGLWLEGKAGRAPGIEGLVHAKHAIEAWAKDQGIHFVSGYSFTEMRPPFNIWINVTKLNSSGGFDWSEKLIRAEEGYLDRSDFFVELDGPTASFYWSYAE